MFENSHCSASMVVKQNRKTSDIINIRWNRVGLKCFVYYIVQWYTMELSFIIVNMWINGRRFYLFYMCYISNIGVSERIKKIQHVLIQRPRDWGTKLCSFFWSFWSVRTTYNIFKLSTVLKITYFRVERTNVCCASLL